MTVREAMQRFGIQEFWNTFIYDRIDPPEGKRIEIMLAKVLALMKTKWTKGTHHPKNQIPQYDEVIARDDDGDIDQERLFKKLTSQARSKGLIEDGS